MSIKDNFFEFIMKYGSKYSDLEKRDLDMPEALFNQSSTAISSFLISYRNAVDILVALPKDVIALAGDYLPFSVSGNFSSINLFEGSFAERVLYDCPPPKIIKMSPNEIVEEMNRVQRIANKITDANGLNPVYIHYSYEDLMAVGNGNLFVANPLYTSTLSDESIAYSLGHEMAHSLCLHHANALLLNDVNKKINEKFGIHISKGDSVVLYYYDRYTEMEADVYGTYLASKAGFDLSDGKQIREDEKWFNKNYYDYWNYYYDINEEHPSIEFRSTLISKTAKTINKVKFSPKEFREEHQMLVDKLKSGKLEDYVWVEKFFANKVMIFTKKEQKDFINRVENIPKLSFEEKARLSKCLTRFSYSISTFYNDDKESYLLPENEKYKDMFSYRLPLLDMAVARFDVFYNVVDNYFHRDDVKRELDKIFLEKRAKLSQKELEKEKFYESYRNKQKDIDVAYYRVKCKVNNALDKAKENIVITKDEVQKILQNLPEYGKNVIANRIEEMKINNLAIYRQNNLKGKRPLLLNENNTNLDMVER